MTEPVWAEHSSLGRVLVVDDEPELMSALREMLRERQYDAVGCTSAHEALDVLQAHGADVLLTDLMMPEMNGIRMLQAAQELDPNLVGVIMTGQGTVSTAVEAMKTGAFDYLLKPFKVEALLPVLTRALDVRRLRLENVRLQETVAIYELSKTVAYVLDSRAILDKLADGALQQCEANEVSVMLPTPDGSELYVAAVRGPGREHLLGERVPFSRGIAGWVAQHGESLTLTGAPDNRFSSASSRPDLRWAISMPMLVGGKLVGVLNVGSTRRAPITLGGAKGLSILAAAAAGALEHARLYAEAREEERRYRLLAERLTALAEFAREVDGTLELDRLFDVALTRVSALTVAAWAHIAQFDTAENGFRIAAVWPPEGRGLRLGVGTTIASDASASGIVLQYRRPYVSPDLWEVASPSDMERALIVTGIRSRIAVPIMIGGDLWGTLGVGFSSPGPATSAQVEFIEAMAAHLAVAIYNAQLYSKVVTAHEEVTALNESLERRVQERTRDLEAASATLAREQARLAATVASMTDGLIVLDSGLRVALCNERGAEMLGTVSAALEGKTAEELCSAIRGSLADSEETLAQWREAIASPDDSTVFEFSATIGSATRDVSARAFAVVGRSGQNRGVAILLRDVSADRQLERMKDEIVAVVSHELRTPLASLVGFADLLLTRTYDEERRRQFLTVIREEGHRLTALINDFLDLQRLESGRASISPEITDLSPLVRRAYAGAPVELQPRIVVDLPSSLPPVRADPDAVHQVLSNLVSNAMKYSPAGGEIRIAVKIADHSLEISVTDNGLGIPPDALPRVFDKFYRVDNSDRREIKGTGLGLAICRQLVAAHGGHIWAESEGLGLGTCMRFTLPLADSPQPAGDILIVEDDLGYARLVGEELASFGFTSTAVDSVEAALEQLAGNAPRAIVLDLIFPEERQGEAMLAEVAGGQHRGVPVVIVTVKDLDDEAEARLRALGARAFFRKGPEVAREAAAAVATVLAEESGSP